MKIHLIAIPKDYPRVAAKAFCGREYPGQGPRQPEDRAIVETACGKWSVHFRAALQDVFKPNVLAGASVCGGCLTMIQALPEEAKRSVLIVFRKGLREDLEPWEVSALSDAQIKKRVYVRINDLQHFWISDLACATGLTREQASPYVAELVERGVLVAVEDREFRATYQMADLQSESGRAFVLEAIEYSKSDREEDEAKEFNERLDEELA